MTTMMRTIGCGVTAAMLAACGDGVLGELPDTDTEGGSTSQMGTSSTTWATTVPAPDTTSATGDPPPTTGEPPPEPPEVDTREVDLLVVVDNSGSTAAQQRALVDGLDSLTDALDGAANAVDYRVAVTTTDLGNPWCDGTLPEGGSLVMSSCRQRLTDFVFQGATQVDVTDEACLEVCSLEQLDVVDPWIDVANSTGTTNLPPGVDPLDALSCALPQGVNGCGFESHLEATYSALLRMDSPTDPAAGFRRPGALLAVVLVTDEADCSFNPDFESIFLPDGNKVFWTDPEGQASPTSGLCWNAGVSCSGGPGVYLGCDPAMKNTSGELTTDGAQSVLYPVTRYQQALGAEVGYFAAITGVTGQGSIVYQDASDPAVQANHAIGYGCSGSGIDAIPPVRIRAVAEALGGDLYSACQANYDAPMAGVAQRILERLP